MVGRITALNSLQKPDVNVSDDGNPNNIGTTAVVLYTCPTGKQAIVKSYKTRFTGFGAGTVGYVRAKGQRLRETTVIETTMVESAGNGIFLVAGETIDLAGDSAANNESAFFDFNIQELPA